MIGLRLLGRLGFETDVAQNGAEVLDAVDRLHYDVVLMDIRMPEMNGLEATEQLRSLYEQDGPRIIGLIAPEEPEMRYRCLEAGMQDVIVKPLTLEQLTDVLKERAERAEPASGASEPAPEMPDLDDIRKAIRKQLISLDGDDALFMSDILGSFMSTATRLITEMRASLEQEDTEALARAAHTMKSSCQLVGLMLLASISRALEMNANAGDPIEQLGHYVAKIERDYTYHSRAIEQEHEALQDRLRQAAA
jgi:CheY-like chemotaxis protein